MPTDPGTKHRREVEQQAAANGLLAKDGDGHRASANLFPEEAR